MSAFFRMVRLTDVYFVVGVLCFPLAGEFHIDLRTLGHDLLTEVKQLRMINAHK